MITYDEEIARGIYKRVFRNYGKLFAILLIVYAPLFAAMALFTLFLMMWSGGNFFDVFFDVWPELFHSNKVLFAFMLIILIFVIVGFPIIFLVIKYFCCEVNCLMVLDKKTLHIIGYLDGQKFEKVVNVKDVKRVEWSGGYSYKNKNYTEFTLYMSDNKKIKNIPVEYESKLYYFLKDLNK